MQNVAALYSSHRLYVFLSCMNVFHQLFVEQEERTQEGGEAIEDIFIKVQKIFENYPLDPIYYHLNIVFEFLKLEYYNHYHVYKKAEKYFEEINDAAPNLLMNYGNFTFPPQFLISKLSRALRVGGEGELVAENELTFGDFEMDPEDVPANTIFQIYQSLCFYYSGRYEDAARIINNLLNEVSLKNYPFV